MRIECQYCCGHGAEPIIKGEEKEIVDYSPCQCCNGRGYLEPKKLTTEQQLSLLEAMGIPVDEWWNNIDHPEKMLSLREFIEREGK
jgi:hypothetical protein